MTISKFFLKKYSESFNCGFCGRKCLRAKRKVKGRKLPEGIYAINRKTCSRVCAREYAYKQREFRERKKGKNYIIIKGVPNKEKGLYKTLFAISNRK